MFVPFKTKLLNKVGENLLSHLAIGAICGILGFIFNIGVNLSSIPALRDSLKVSAQADIDRDLKQDAVINAISNNYVTKEDFDKKIDPLQRNLCSLYKYQTGIDCSY